MATFDDARWLLGREHGQTKVAVAAADVKVGDRISGCAHTIDRIDASNGWIRFYANGETWPTAVRPLHSTVTIITRTDPS